MQYIEDENGVMVDGHIATRIRGTLAQVFRTLDMLKIAPESWGKASSTSAIPPSARGETGSVRRGRRSKWI